MGRRYKKTNKSRYYFVAIILLIIATLSIGFSSFQNKLYVSDTQLKIRLHENVRVSDISIKKTNQSAVSNYEDFNVSRLVGNVTLPSASSYVLYKVDLTNYGNVKSGLLKITNNNTSVDYSVCNSSGGSCTTNVKTEICNNDECTLGATKEIFVKISSASSGTYNVSLDFDFEPYSRLEHLYFIDEEYSEEPSNAYQLYARFNLKNYESEIEHFIEWISTLSSTKGLVGYTRYEECDRPRPIYL